MKYNPAITTNRILLGLLMLIPGLTKLFVMGPSGVSGFLSGLGLPIPMFFAIILITAEIISGIAILANYQLKFATIAPIIILAVAGVLTALPAQNWPTFLMHLALMANYWLIATLKN